MPTQEIAILAKPFLGDIQEKVAALGGTPIRLVIEDDRGKTALYAYTDLEVSDAALMLITEYKPKEILVEIIEEL